MKTLNYIVVLSIVLLTSCVSQKKYTELQDRSESCETELKASNNERLVLESNLSTEKNKAENLKQQMEYFKSTNTNLLERLSDLSVVSKSGAESIKKSLEALNEQNKFIKDLTSSNQRKDSLNLALVMNLKRSLGLSASYEYNTSGKETSLSIDLFYGFTLYVFLTLL